MTAPDPNRPADEPLLEVRDLQVRFPVRLTDLSLQQLLRRRRERPVVHAVEEVSFTIGRGQTLGLVGESGSGKSTIGHAVMRLVEATAGTITLDGVDVRSARGADLRKLRRTVAMVFQDPLSSLDPRRTIRQALLDPLEIHRLHAGDRDARVRQLLELVGLPEGLLERYPHQLSGGQRQRVCIGRALAVEPQLIILDEATASLDVSVQAQILNLLKRLQRELGISYLFIAHDLAAVEYLSHQVLVLYLGRAMETAGRTELYAHPEHPYTAALLSAVPAIDPAVEKHRERTVLSGEVPSPLSPPSGCVFRTRCPIAIPACAEDIPDPVPISPSHRAACIRIDTA